MTKRGRRRPPGLLRGVPLAELSTLGTGGSARYALDVDSTTEAAEAIRWAASEPLPVLFVGDGSNILFPDEGYPGLILTNRMDEISRSGMEVEVGGGQSLMRLVRWANRNRLAGMERLFGIPGTVAGAVVGNAGAYGQEICETVREVTVLSQGGIEKISSEDLHFSYRHSRLKDSRGLFVLSCRFRFTRAQGNLQAISESILKERWAKYPPEMKCPGSFFKNVPAKDLREEVFRTLPDDYSVFGKIPAGRLLEAVGAKGARSGGAGIASHHANLFVNLGGARSADFIALATEYSRRVFDTFGIQLEPEVLIVTRHSANIPAPGEPKEPGGLVQGHPMDEFEVS